MSNARTKTIGVVADPGCRLKVNDSCALLPGHLHRLANVMTGMSDVRAGPRLKALWPVSAAARRSEMLHQHHP